MNRRSPRRRGSRGAAASSGPFPFASHPRTLQLCSEALETLSLALASSADPRLADAAIRDVVPHPDASCLRVVVSAPAEETASVREALAHAHGYLRSEVATELDRKRAPELVFIVIPTLDVAPDEGGEPR